MNNLIKLHGISTFEIDIIRLAEFDITTAAAVAAAANGGKVILSVT